MSVKCSFNAKPYLIKSDRSNTNGQQALTLNETIRSSLGESCNLGMSPPWKLTMIAGKQQHEIVYL